MISPCTRELIKKPRQLGFAETDTKKHIKFRHSDGRWTVVSKGSHEIDIDLLKKMEQQINEKLR
jgi:predicted RNA binding protein YcfA (HicA-like mRNA interferase family)